MTLPDVANSESAQANLNHGSIVENLKRDVGVVDAFLQMGHEYEIACLEPAVVQGVVIDVAQDGFSAQTVGRVVRVDELAQTVDRLGTLLLVALVVLVVHVFDFFQVDATHLLFVLFALHVNL